MNRFLLVCKEIGVSRWIKCDVDPMPVGASFDFQKRTLKVVDHVYDFDYGDYVMRLKVICVVVEEEDDG